MIPSLYPTTLIIATSLLIAWSYFGPRKLVPKLWRSAFFLSMIVYFGSLLFIPGTLEDKFAFLFRDMMIMAGVGTVFQLLVRNTGAFLVGLFMMIGGFIYLLQTKKLNPPEEKQVQAEQAVDALAPSLLASDGEWLVEVAPGTSVQQLKALLADYDVRISRAFFPGDEGITELDDYCLVDVLDNNYQTITAVEEVLENAPFVDWVEGNENISIAPMPAESQKRVDPKFGIDDPGVEHLWGFEAMNVDKLYQYLKQKKVKPKKQALIAILDTGVDGKHEDLRANYKSTQSKYDRDVKMHGTHCAGIAAAVSNNGVGIASFSPNEGMVKITSIKVLSDFGMGTQQGIIKGIIEAADKGADVISMSLGGRSSQSRQTAYQKAVDYANQKGAIVITAAGNSNMDAKDYSPVNTPGVIGVSALDEELNRASFSNTVNNIKMAVAAPGVNIYSTVPDNKYASFNGTSMATPYVAGLVGLMKSIKPNLTTQEAYRILSQTGKNTQDTRLTKKLIQPHLAVRALVE